MIHSSPFDIAVIGGGAAGMVAALEAARAGARVLLLEHNEKLGKKLYITGKGRCNLTNACGREELMKNLIHNGRFCFSALAALDNKATCAYFEKLGLPLKQERGGRVFPRSDKASDVIAALKKGLDEAAVNVRLNCAALHIAVEEGRVEGIQLKDGNVERAKCVVVATGGFTYPGTGSTGDGYRFARELGHTIAQPSPSLAGVEVKEKWCAGLMGLALKNVSLTLYRDGKRIYRELGEMVFAHYGIDGPLALTASAHMAGEDAARFRLAVDVKPGLTPQELDGRVVKDFAKYANRTVGNSLFELLPKSLGAEALRQAGIAADTPCNAITRAQRAAFVAWLKAAPITPKGLRPPEEAVITRGGVAVKEVNPSTMESRLVKGLYFAGEVLDVDALTGGFNLQIAFSTGFVAGRSAARAVE